MGVSLPSVRNLFLVVVSCGGSDLPHLLNCDL